MGGPRLCQVEGRRFYFLPNSPNILVVVLESGPGGRVPKGGLNVGVRSLSWALEERRSDRCVVNVSSLAARSWANFGSSSALGGRLADDWSVGSVCVRGELSLKREAGSEIGSAFGRSLWKVVSQGRTWLSRVEGPASVRSAKPKVRCAFGKRGEFVGEK